ncbi:WD domain, G-beta repeat [Gemmata obscuriglobus]|uniref:Uncharacterized protein n=1 Tax=Gemmata obscuriglobus TaxID=114 RepID=A0A2Z3GXN6_9BACT|nr:WD-40 repeat protein [Gemmata obscuriglobus]AWM36176.1 hypothetical protein C1280_03565 [Gemmata obscuriglobus]QEG31230.1 WD domain, G-beta repeat [Gemmata obscuriglobus]VTS10568.1 wd40 repeat-containing protein : WD40 repeat-containing protein OS=Haliscomenobacter hydrossis (strain ATCC 27775 / DSM 1100 / LMG 10767 / O) GN=Halhy_6675 PE=4 SV=1: WD40: WD40 [Gemmata obscuriglobus UQM 2246]
MREYKLKKCKRVHSVHFTPDGVRLLALGGAEARMVDAAVWLNLATGDSEGRVERFVTCAAVDPGLTRYVVGGPDHFARGVAAVEWTALDRAVEWRRFVWPKRTLPPTYKNVSGLAFDPTGSWLAIGHSRVIGPRGANRSRPLLTIVDRDTGEAEAELPTVREACVLSFSADGARLAVTGGLDGDTAVTVFDVAARKELFTFEPKGTVTRCAVFLPDGRLAVANGRFVYVLPADRATPQLTLDGHPKQVNAVAVTQDGRRVLTASHDGLIRTWDTERGEPGASFDWHIGPVTALAFAPDGLTCAAAALNGKVVVWDMDA